MPAKLQLYEWSYAKAEGGKLQVLARSLEQALGLVILEDETAHACIKNVAPRMVRLSPMVLNL